MPRVVLSSDNESSFDSTGESRSGSSSQSSDRSSSTKLIDRRTSRSSNEFRIGGSRPVSEVTRQSNDFLELGDRSTGAVRAGGRMPPIRSSSANIQIGRSPSRHIVPLNIPKGYSVYNSETKLDRLLAKYKIFDDHIYRAPLPTERLPGSNPFEVAIYKDSMDGRLRFPIHPFFVAIFREFHLTPSQVAPNAWSDKYVDAEEAERVTKSLDEGREPETNKRKSHDNQRVRDDKGKQKGAYDGSLDSNVEPNLEPSIESPAWTLITRAQVKDPDRWNLPTRVQLFNLKIL
ncbi:Uncharacterized protein Fot_00826 [Forsythia ovata]|uniref:Uncharacterized protein n=1 Tax=Forsythia ovata TaxID=205694 RepID=A0ABD1X287_9LAMI